MEDVMPESESLMIPLNRSPRGGGGGDGGGGEERCEGKEVGRDEEKSMNGDGEGKDEEKGGGGILTHLISIVSPRGTTKAGEVGKRKGEFEVDDVGNGGFGDKPGENGSGGGGGENGGGGGVISMISNFFNQSDGGGGGGVNEVDKEAEKVMKGIGNKRMKTAADEEEVGGGGGKGIIENIVSHLPEDVAPSTDEASILLTSIVKD